MRHYYISEGGVLRVTALRWSPCASAPTGGWWRRAALTGRCGFGQVHRGEYRGAEVAIKSLCTTSGADEDKRTLQMLFNEAWVMSELRHPHVVEFVGLQAW